MPETFRLAANTDRASVIAAIGITLKMLPMDKAQVVEIKDETRSKAQNRYLWGVVYKTIVDYMRDHHGRDYSDEAVHETLKELYIPSRVEVMGRGEVKIYKSTTDLTRKEFAEYVEHVMRWAAEFGCVVPDPDWSWRQSSEP